MQFFEYCNQSLGGRVVNRTLSFNLLLAISREPLMWVHVPLPISRFLQINHKLLLTSMNKTQILFLYQIKQKLKYSIFKKYFLMKSSPFLRWRRRSSHFLPPLRAGLSTYLYLYEAPVASTSLQLDQSLMIHGSGTVNKDKKMINFHELHTLK